jgi:very-short-patch-repair endonuclease
VFEIRITETRKFCSLRCIRHTEECKEGQRIRSFGRVFSEETRKKMGISKLGEKNPMKRSEVKEKVRAYRVGKSLQESGHGSDCACCVCKAKRGETKGENSPYYGHHSSDETRKKQREAKLGKPSPNKGKKVSLQRLQKIRDLWKDPEYVKKVFRKVFPDKPEEYLRSLSDQNFPGQFKYTGNGQLIVAGKCPDFVHTSKPLLIELFGDYWHGQERTGIPNEQHERERIELFRLAGYETLVIWEHELKDPSRVVEKISGFLRISYVRS